MALSPSDIRGQTFEQVRRGYDPEQVQTYLEVLAAEWSRMQHEIATSLEALENARQSEQAMRATMLAVSEAKDEVLAAATEQADRLRDDAARDADRRRNAALDDSSEILIEARRQALDLMAKTRIEVNGLTEAHQREEELLLERVHQLRAVVRRTENLLKGIASGALGDLGQAHLMLDEAPVERVIEVVPDEPLEPQLEAVTDHLTEPAEQSPLPAAVDRLLTQLRDIG